MLVASQSLTAGAIASNFDTARPTVSKHLQILTECELLKQEQNGREQRTSLLLDVPVELVWEVWTKPEHIKHYRGPDGFTNTIEKSAGNLEANGFKQHK